MILRKKNFENFKISENNINLSQTGLGTRIIANPKPIITIGQSDRGTSTHIYYTLL
jgi:hypothetical protein